MIKTNSIECKSSICKFQLIILTLIFFTGACFFTIEKRYIYIGTILLISAMIEIYFLLSMKRFVVMIQQKFTWWLILLFGMYTFYGMVLPIFGEYNWDYILFILLIIVDVISIFSTLTKEESTETFIRACAYASILICIYIATNEWNSILMGSTRIGDSASGNVNTVSMYLGLFSITSIYKIICEKNKKFIPIYFLQILFMLLTGSKKAILFIGVGMILMVILEYKYKIHKYFFPIICMLIITVIIFNNEYLYNIIGFRIVDFVSTLFGLEIKGANLSHSTEERMYMYKIASELFMQRPIFGSGWFYFAIYSGLGTYTHNNYMELLVTYGLVGFVLYYGMFLYAIKNIIRLLFKDRYAKLYFVLLISILINDFAAINFSSDPKVYIILFFAVNFINKRKIS